MFYGFFGVKDGNITSLTTSDAPLDGFSFDGAHDQAIHAEISGGFVHSDILISDCTFASDTILVTGRTVTITA